MWMVRSQWRRGMELWASARPWPLHGHMVLCTALASAAPSHGCFAVMFAVWSYSWFHVLGLMALRCRTEEFWIVLRVIVSARLHCYCPQPERRVAQQRDPVVKSERVRSIHSCCLWVFDLFSIWSWRFDSVVHGAFVNGLEFDSNTLLWVSSLPPRFFNLFLWCLYVPFEAWKLWSPVNDDKLAHLWVNYTFKTRSVLFVLMFLKFWEFET